MIMIYHGSSQIIEHPEFGKGKKTNDYGRGFYCTEHAELAKEWACGSGKDGFLNRYSIELDGLRVLRLNDPPYTILTWLAVLAQNRTYWENSAISEEAKNYLREHFLVDMSSYDVIIGYRADDSYFAFAQGFVAGTLSLRKLSEAMHLGNLGEQIVLKSAEAFARIRFGGYEPVPADVYYAKKRERDLRARREFREKRGGADSAQDLFMLDIMRERMEDGDPRLR